MRAKHGAAYSAPTVPSGGRPRFVVTSGQIERLLSLSFTKTRIAELLGISRITVWRRLKELNIDRTFDCITDDELNELIRVYRTDHPFTGL